MYNKHKSIVNIIVSEIRDTKHIMSLHKIKDTNYIGVDLRWK